MSFHEVFQRLGLALPPPPEPCPELAAGATVEAPRCRRCGALPEHVQGGEYADAVADERECGPEEVTAEECRAYVRSGEGTYNPRTGGYWCTACYIAIGQPEGKAP